MAILNISNESFKAMNNLISNFESSWVKLEKYFSIFLNAIFLRSLTFQVLIFGKKIGSEMQGKKCKRDMKMKCIRYVGNYA